MRKLKVLTLLTIIPTLLLGFSGMVSADSSSLVGMVDNGDVYVKSGTTSAAWTTRLTTGESASDLEMYGDRVGFIDSGNNLWLKQGLTSPWFEEMNNVQSYALTETGLLVLQYGGDVWYKSGESPTAMWDSSMISNDARQVYLSPSQLVIIDNDGNLMGKVLSPLDGVSGVGPNGPWGPPIAQNATTAAVTDSRLVYIDNQGNVYGKDGPIFYSWWNNGQVITDDTTQVALSGTMYCWVWAGNTRCKPYSFGDTPMFVFGPTTNSLALSPGKIVVYGNASDGNNYLYGLDYSAVTTGQAGYALKTPGWNTLSTTGSEITTNQE